MKAAVIKRFGEADVFEHVEVDTPTPPADHVLIKVLACGINRYDTYLRMGAITREITFPHVMGADISGTIEALGAKVDTCTVGQRVIVAPGFPTNRHEWDFQPENFASSYAVTGTRFWGGYAQYASVPARFVIADTTGLTPEETACLPLVLVTAVHAVRTVGRVTRGTTVLVQAGASGSGSMCIQVAKALGGRVATTVGAPDKLATAEQVGADLVVNHRQEEFAERVLQWTHGRGVDVVIDNVGGEVFTDNLRCLRRGGTLVNFGAVGGMHARINLLDLLFRQLSVHGSMMGSMEELRFGLSLVREGALRPILDRTFPLAAVARAHEYMEQRRVRGKLVLLPWADTPTHSESA
ncbi:MAG: zinc-binding dehydrogenase [bacterium]|nr:zinc-binding dehydrogenase [bacterium]